NQDKPVTHAEGHAMTKDGGKHSLSPEWHAAQECLLLLRDAHDGRQVKEVAFRSDERLSQFIHRSERESGKACTGEVARRFRDQVQQARLIQLTAKGYANAIEGCKM